jgi:hypothetical protein
MKPRLALSVAAVGACLMLAIAPAQARWHHRHHDEGAAAAGIAGFAAGAILGGALASRPHYYYGPPAYAYEPGRDADAIAYCERHFRTYNPRTGLYRGYDGRYHHCP